MDLRQALDILGLPANASGDQARRALQEGLKIAKGRTEKGKLLEAFNVWQLNQTHEKKANAKPFFGVPTIFKHNDEPKGSQALSTKQRNRFKEAFAEGVGTGKAKSHAKVHLWNLVQAYVKRLLLIFAISLCGSLALAALATNSYRYVIPLDAMVGTKQWAFLSEPRPYKSWQPLWIPRLEDCLSSHDLSPQEYNELGAFKGTHDDFSAVPRFPRNGISIHFHGHAAATVFTSWEELMKVPQQYKYFGLGTHTPDSSCEMAAGFVGDAYAWHHRYNQDWWSVFYSIVAGFLAIIVVGVLFSGGKLLREYNDFVREIDAA